MRFLKWGVDRLLAAPKISRARLGLLLFGALVLAVGAVATNAPATLAGSLAADSPSAPSTLLSSFTRTAVLTGLQNPVQTRFAPNGDMYVAQQCGTIRLAHNGVLVATPVIAIPNTQCDSERGLLGIALDGSFASNGYLYAAYTNTDGYSRLSRFTVVNGVASPASETILYKYTQPSAVYHNINDVMWGPDGKLWVSSGDGYTCGSACGTNGQLLTSAHGKMLRFNPDGSVPSDNPYATAAAPQSYIWSLGYRSNFRFNFMANGTPIVGDVGVHTSTEDKWQRFYMVSKGSNYGWSSYEYHEPCTSPPGANLSNCPFYEYQNAPVGANAVTGFLQYEGTAYPPVFQNVLFYSEYGTQTIHYLTFTDSTYTSVATDTIFDSAAGTTVDLEMGPDGNLYSTSIYQGTVYKYTYSGPPNPTPVTDQLQIGTMYVKDTTNAANWSVQSNLQ
ncbi:MAG TPA: PQQ-dependent sugar dehydrogenase, partial [Chloroflexota bacterium]